MEDILLRYIEDYRYNYIHKLPHFVTTLNSRKNCFINFEPKDVKSSDFLSILYSNPLGEFRKPKFKTGDEFHITKYYLPFRKGYKPQFTQEVFGIVAISSRKSPPYTKNDEQDEIIRGKFCQKELIKFI